MRDGKFKAVLLWRLTPYNPLRALSGEAASLTTFHGATGFPIVRHFKYLGIQLSYHNHADLTLKFRQQQAASKKAKVRKFVNSRRGSATASRLLVWRSTVWASASFGLETAGLALSGARKLQAWFSRQLRAITHQPAHLTKVRTTDLLTKFRVDPPIQQLADRAQTRLKDLRALSIQQPSSILVRSEVLAEATVIHADLRYISTQITAELDTATQEIFTCCDKIFRSSKAGLSTACNH